MFCFMSVHIEVISGKHFTTKPSKQASKQASNVLFNICSHRGDIHCPGCRAVSRKTESRFVTEPSKYVICRRVCEHFFLARKILPAGAVKGLITLRASLSGTFLQTRPDLVTSLKGHSLSPRSCPPTRSAPSERFGY